MDEVSCSDRLHPTPPLTSESRLSLLPLTGAIRRQRRTHGAGSFSSESATFLSSVSAVSCAFSTRFEMRVQ